ncbi:hypothetical protein D3C71_1255750 [compost metagenome]
MPFADVADHARGALGGVLDRFSKSGDATLEGVGAGLAVGGRRQTGDDDNSPDVEIVVPEQHAAGFVGKALLAQSPQLLFDAVVDIEVKLTQRDTPLGHCWHIMHLDAATRRIALPDPNQGILARHSGLDLLRQRACLAQDARVRHHD